MIPFVSLGTYFSPNSIHTHTHTPVFLSFHMNGSLHVQGKGDNETVLHFSLG